MMVVAGRGRQRGGGTAMGKGGTYRHVALGAETSGRGWWVAGAVNVQVGRAY